VTGWLAYDLLLHSRARVSGTTAAAMVTQMLGQAYSRCICVVLSAQPRSTVPLFHITHLKDRTRRDGLLLLQHIISINNLWFTSGPVPRPPPRLAAPHQLVATNEAALLQLLQQLLQSKQDCCCRCLLGTAAAATTYRQQQTLSPCELKLWQ